jgi:hypothetical protein
MSKQGSPQPKTAGEKPIHQLRHRNIKAAIWRKETAKGVMYDVKVTRGYKEDDYWRDSHSFGFDDLLIVAKLMYDAHSWVSSERTKDRQDNTPQAPAVRTGGKRRDSGNPST